MSTSELSGLWTYRMFNPNRVPGDQAAPPRELDLILAEAFLSLRTAPDPKYLEGMIEWQGGGLNLNGTLGWGESFDIVGTGRRETDGWEYRYHGRLTPRWESGVDQPEAQRALVGSVIRVKPHNGQPGGRLSEAGSVYSFIAMKGAPLTSGISGPWEYRSFHNDPTCVYKIAPQNGREVILQEAVFNLRAPTSTTLEGTISWPGRFLDLRGTIQPGGGGEPSSFQITGIGRSGTDTAGWEYRYQGHLAWHWPNGIKQVPALVGSVMRAEPHGQVPPAGYVAPFIAVKQP
jgi:hypothetical protein